MPDDAVAPHRPRNAEATRAAILRAARTHFAQASYEHVGLRAIAAEVGINVALVVRYFGSKEQLFATAVADSFTLGDLLTVERAQLGMQLARYVLAKDAQRDTLAPLLTLLRSATHPHAGAILRDSLDAHFVQPLASWLGGEQALLRAALIAATLNGLVVSRAVIQLEPLASTDSEQLAKMVAPVLQGYIDGAFP